MIWLKRISICLGIVILFLLIKFSDTNRNLSLCKSIRIEILDESKSFISRNEIQQILKNESSNLDSLLISEIPFFELEQSLENHCYIKNAEVSIDVDGNLEVFVENRTPIVRIHKSNGDDFYLDESGFSFPISSNFTENILVANGNIEDSLDLKSILKVSKYVCKSLLWNSQITQVYMNSKKEIELIPRVGNHTILFGNSDLIEEKFDKLNLFYSKGVKQTGWRKYKEINLKFKNQIVCVKR